MYWKTKESKNREGLILGVFFIGIFFTRFMIEFIKQDQEAFEANMLINMGQWLSIPFILAGITLIVRALKKAPVYYKEEVTAAKK
jgi:prolipoprotein diacylglyceryltransferase